MIRLWKIISIFVFYSQIIPLFEKKNYKFVLTWLVCGIRNRSKNKATSAGFWLPVTSHHIYCFLSFCLPHLLLPPSTATKSWTRAPRFFVPLPSLFFQQIPHLLVYLAPPMPLLESLPLPQPATSTAFRFFFQYDSGFTSKVKPVLSILSILWTIVKRARLMGVFKKNE